VKLKHSNLMTSDADFGRFFERFFGFNRALELGSGAFTVMSNDEDFVLTLLKPKKLDPVAYPETFQVGFYLDNSPAVQAKRDDLATAGLSAGGNPWGRTGRGTHFLALLGMCWSKSPSETAGRRVQLNVGEAGPL